MAIFILPIVLAAAASDVRGLTQNKVATLVEELYYENSTGKPSLTIFAASVDCIPKTPVGDRNTVKTVKCAFRYDPPNLKNAHDTIICGVELTRTVAGWSIASRGRLAVGWLRPAWAKNKNLYCHTSLTL